MDRIYLDHAATSPLTEEARRAMEPWLDCGNPSSPHAEGRRAKAAIDESREIVTGRLGISFPDLIFTSSATESAVMAIVGAALARSDSTRTRVIFGSTEHHCVLNTQPILEALGFQVELAPCDRYARIDLQWLQSSLASDHVLMVAAMHANNELGTVQPISQIAKMCESAGTLLFCDAVQSFGKLELSASDLGADLLSISSHKLGGPKGAGALAIRPGTRLQPILAGGGQERELRGGTENVAAIRGFSAAVQTATPDSYHHHSALRDQFLHGLLALGALPTLAVHVDSLPTHLHVRIPGISAESMLIVLDRLGISAGSGAACSSGSIDASHVLLACGYTPKEAKEGLRFTMGSRTDSEQISRATLKVGKAVATLRETPGARTSGSVFA